MHKIELLKIKKGSTFFESIYGQRIEMIAMTDGSIEINSDGNEYAICLAKVISNGRIVPLTYEIGFRHYGPNLYMKMDYGKLN